MILIKSNPVKKVLPILLISFFNMALIFTSCGHASVESRENEEENESTENESTENKSTEIELITADPYTYTSKDVSYIENLSGVEFTKEMGNGINLGNTMEATATWIPFSTEDMTEYEQAWGQPVTTKEMFQSMKSAGFDSVRIPVAWTHTMDWSRGDFEINKNYLARVKTVVDYALDSGLIVMINDHWDYGWWGLFSHDEELAWKIYKAIWNQVGTYFKDYPLTLIFEGGNEEIGDRLNDAISNSSDSRLDSSINYTSQGTLTEAECYAKLLEINQTFVDIIRAQGGNNEKRFLLIPGYNTDIDKTTASSYQMPSDSSNTVQKLIVSVHYYLPATYAIADKSSNSWGYSDTWGTDAEILAQNEYFYKLKTFVDKGYGVIIGEYGAASKDDGDEDVITKKDGMEEWMTNILDNSDKYNYCPFLWDCNTFFKKDGSQLGFTDSEIADVYDGRNYAAEKEGNSDGGTINYSAPETILSYESSSIKVSGNNYSSTFTLSKEKSITKGQTITVTYKRPAITSDYVAHYIQITSSNQKDMISNIWDNGSHITYPSKSEGTITLKYTATEDFNLNSLTLTIINPEGEGITPSSALTITDFSVKVSN
ncbi:MAG: glycoside hydrolase family 5 protein [Treponema sp.]|nr:glycoside hydrolase family 5 protein [Treponema sp.]